jgi:putative spermidine/putrescine transport system substrate-binding protein
MKSLRYPLRCVAVLCVLATFILPRQSALAASARAEPTLVFGGLGGAFQTTWQQTIIPAFEKKYHVHVEYVVPGLDQQVMARLQASNSAFDLVQLGQNNVLNAADQGLLYKFNPKQIPNLKNVYSLFKKPFGGYAVGTNFDAEGIGWNTEDVTSSIKSWRDLWKSGLKGKIALPNITSSIAIDFIVMTALLNGGAVKHGHVVQVTNVNKAFAALKKLRPGVKLFYDTSFAGNTDLQTKQADVILTYHGRIQSLKDGNFPAKWVAPAEGIWPSLSTISIAKGAPHKKLDEKFINFMLSPKMEGAFCSALLYAPVTTNAILTPTAQKEVLHGPKLISKFLLVNYRQINKVLPQWTDLWNREIVPNP